MACDWKFHPFVETLANKLLQAEEKKDKKNRKLNPRSRDLKLKWANHEFIHFNTAPISIVEAYSKTNNFLIFFPYPGISTFYEGE